MSNDKRMIKKYLSEYFEIVDKRTDLVWDILDTDYDLFDYTYYDNYNKEDNGDIEKLQKYLQKLDSNFIYSVVLLALDAPLDNYMSIVEYSDISDALRNILPLIEDAFHIREPLKHSECLKFLLTEIVSRKLFLCATSLLCSYTLHIFEYIYEHPNEFLEKNFIDKHNLWLNKTFDELLLDIYINTIK